MMLSPVQIFMDSSDWTQSMMQDRGFRPSANAAISTTEDLLSCSRPLLERGLKPQPEQALKCPRCDSTNTKFCYYNNYSLSQPRHFCKTCRRYWTKGGALRTVPVGGGCRKNKKTKRAPADQAVFSQNEPSTSGAPSSANALSNLNPATNSGSNMFFNNSSNDMNAFARGQQAAVARYGDQSALPNCNSSDFLGLSCGPSTTQSSFGPLTLNPISPLTALNSLHSLKSSFPGLGDFPVISKSADHQGSSAIANAPPPDWQLPPEPTLLDSNINFWNGGPWSDLSAYGSSSM
ncbi:hypothetical protein SUGI_0807270 [Cryptomeria japonica]|uniref:dof zinc finger protein 4 n=1 Tax=Cryptomeria japonica TaxID=3369 RepID=UPI0024148E1A|nr:dof zinc finger protein 4 [Cryptomeria japonica]GLJ39505.1 hypothetical protein SUGI_0807270 [Cryptomeria japonica]